MSSATGELPWGLYGAFDRYNYGDLLFPLVTRRLLEESTPKRRFRTFGLIESDLSRYGAEPTVSIGSLDDSAPCEALIVCGGEILSQSWCNMLCMLVEPEQAEALHTLRGAFGSEAAEEFSHAHLQAWHSSPGIFLESDFSRPTVTAYNSVGGWPLEHARDEDLTIVSKGLADAAFVSARDRRTQELLQARCGLEVDYAPDVAVLLSRLFSEADLRQAATASVVAELEQAPYWCLQVNPAMGVPAAREIARQADSIARRTGSRTLLTPIGRCTRWQDRTALASIREEMSRPAMILSEATTIFDIAFALAGCACFVGTSLHGIVTAVSYGVPFVAIQSEDPKVGNNLLSWGAYDRFPEIPIAGIAEAVVERIDSRSAVQELAEGLKSQALSNVRRLAAAVQSA